ncbi:MAG TPA: hypothetical protein VEL07_21110, partial [Planctomycetota bacterium]|nr:hypothetical protein [Planctomycetota bacterium]
LATSSDDGSRVWLDRDGDGAVGAGEWGANGWGGGQGDTLRTVHDDVRAGLYRLRVQWEEGGGGNCCRLLWKDPGDAAAPSTVAAWRVVPDAAFAAAAIADVVGPVTLRGAITGPGSMLRLGAGALLATGPAVAALEIVGDVALASDIALADVTLATAPDARLSLAGHALTLTGGGVERGTIALAGGALSLPAGSHGIDVEGPGTLRAAAGVTRVRRLVGDIAVVGDGSIVRDDVRCVASVACAAPLATVLTVADDAPAAVAIVATIDVPPGAPADLGVGAWRCDRGGAWHQALASHPLAPGRHRVRIALDPRAPLAPEGHRGRWSAEAAATFARIGLVLFSSLPGRGVVLVDARMEDAVIAAPAPSRLVDLVLDGLRDGAAHGATGRRWQMRVRPSPWPANPYDPQVIRIDLAIVEPDGTQRRIAAFADQPVRRIDRGDGEAFVADGAACFRARFRPRLPGRHRLRLLIAEAGGDERAAALPDLVVAGEAWDGIARPDAADPRFFSAGGRMIWPVGHNLNSIYDTRSRQQLGTKLTPDRGSFARDALLERLAAMGGTGCETWLSPWNLGLEWTPAWAGYAGAGRYHAGHAWALDRFLDRASELGVHVNLSLFNHGMARDGLGAEDDWPHHPWRAANGGWLARPAELFRDERAFASQRAQFRYLAARWGDCPALIGWKLWAEVNLAHADHADVVAWHARAAEALRATDPYGRAVTTHWCGDWTNADPAIARLPGIGYLTIDAYHGMGTMIADLISESVADPSRPGRGLGAYGKPVWVTEFGGSSHGCPPARLVAEHAIGPWAAVVTGHAASPLLWWFEWIDQRDAGTPYAALRRFIAGEDLRGREARAVAPTVTGLWCRAWSRPGRLLGYLLDPAWAMSGGDGRPVVGAEVVVGDAVESGAIAVEWWDADAGSVIARVDIDHPGGLMTLRPPEFARHVAFKMWRLAR